MTKEDVAEAVRAWCQVWPTRDIATLLAREAPSFGFGFRQCTPRDHVAAGQAGQRARCGRLFGRMDAYSVVPEDVETSVMGELGLAWGVFIEEFQQKGHPPERARVRFSKVLTKGAHGWQVRLYHRDIQPFPDAWRYLKALTVRAPATSAERRRRNRVSWVRGSAWQPRSESEAAVSLGRAGDGEQPRSYLASAAPRA